MCRLLIICGKMRNFATKSRLLTKPDKSMKQKLLLMLALLCAVVQGAWAVDGILCTASDKGRVICTDGTIYDNVAAATADGKTAVALIFVVDEVNK